MFHLLRKYLLMTFFLYLYFQTFFISLNIRGKCPIPQMTSLIRPEGQTVVFGGGDLAPSLGGTKTVFGGPKISDDLFLVIDQIFQIFPFFSQLFPIFGM